MGAWGTGISANDEYMDVYSEIMDQFNKGVSIQDVIDNILNKYESEFEGDCNLLHNLYFATAFASWECGYYYEELYNRVKEIITSGSDIECWRELQASPSDLKKREKALTVFLDKLSIPKASPKKPKVIKFKPALFEKGDVLAIRFENGFYSGAVVLENLIRNCEFGINLILKAYFNKTVKPTVEDIFNARVYDYAWYSPLQSRKYIKQIEKIGKTDINFRYSPEGAGSRYASWAYLVSEVKENYFCIKENSDIENISAFMKLTPDTITRRNLERVKNSF